MIHEIGVELGAALVAQGCPVKVVDGPEDTGTASSGRERIVIEHDERGDSFRVPATPQKNPKPVLARMIGAKVTIYAQSTRPGAQPFEHRRRAEKILDLVCVALGVVLSTRKAAPGAFVPTGGRFIVPADLEKSERQGGAAYELTFTVGRAVFDRTWADAAAAEAERGEDFTVTTQATRTVALNGGEEESF
jgi:hypothetical protein